MTKDEFYEKSKSGELKWERRQSKEETVNPKNIIVDKDWNSDHSQFWTHHGRSKDEYFDYMRSGQADNQRAPKVYKCDDKYVLVDDGSHRVAVAQELNRPIKVNVTGEYVTQNQAQNKDVDYEDEISM